MSDQPLTCLNHYRLLGRSGLRVSPLCLGAMTFGEEWGIGANEETSQKVFNLYVKSGGNFVDTANVYNNGASEALLGKFMKGRRQKIVLATKDTFNNHEGDPNMGGNHRKSLTQNVEESLRRLKTDYIDLLWFHMWDHRTPVEETLRGLDDLVRAGKILYAGVSNWPAWVVAQANTISQLRGWTPFIAQQVQYSLIKRQVERSIVPQSLAFDMAIMPYSPLGGGLLTGKHRTANEKRSKKVDSKRVQGLKDELADKKNQAILKEVERIAKEVGRSPAQVSLNWLLQKPGVVSPIIGARTPTQLRENISCLDFTLNSEYVGRLDEVGKVDLGYPEEFTAKESLQHLLSGNTRVQDR